VKGALVLFMVVYHTINYSPFQSLSFQYLSFLPPSFILIAGFVVGQVYAAKYDLKSIGPYLRLAVRGLKLLLIFAVLNLGYFILLKHGLESGLREFGNRTSAMFLSGNGRNGIFEVLLPIAYFLMIAPVLLWTASFSSLTAPLAGGVFFLTCAVAQSLGYESKNLELLSVGVIGMSLGAIPMAAIHRLGARWSVVVGLYIAYRLCAAIFGEQYVVQTLASVATILVLYCIAAHLRPDSLSFAGLVLLGQYSLLGYLVQIAALQLAVRLAGGKFQGTLALPLWIAAIAGLTLGSVLAVRLARKKNAALDRLYRLVFA
jgi:hypothetical protein